MQQLRWGLAHHLTKRYRHRQLVALFGHQLKRYPPAAEHAIEEQCASSTTNDVQRGEFRALGSEGSRGIVTDVLGGGFRRILLSQRSETSRRVILIA